VNGITCACTLSLTQQTNNNKISMNLSLSKQAITRDTSLHRSSHSTPLISQLSKDFGTPFRKPLHSSHLSTIERFWYSIPAATPLLSSLNYQKISVLHSSRLSAVERYCNCFPWSLVYQSELISSLHRESDIRSITSNQTTE